MGHRFVGKERVSGRNPSFETPPHVPVLPGRGKRVTDSRIDKHGVAGCP